MKVKDLIQRLEQHSPYKEIMILDGFNGGGVPRTINLGPAKHRITKEDQDEAADCEELKRGTEVIVIGYGSY